MRRRKPKSPDYSVVLCTGSAAAVAASGLYISLSNKTSTNNALDSAPIQSKINSTVRLSTPKKQKAIPKEKNDAIARAGKTTPLPNATKININFYMLARECLDKLNDGIEQIMFSPLSYTQSALAMVPSRTTDLFKKIMSSCHNISAISRIRDCIVESLNNAREIFIGMMRRVKNDSLMKLIPTGQMMAAFIDTTGAVVASGLSYIQSIEMIVFAINTSIIFLLRYNYGAHIQKRIPDEVLWFPSLLVSIAFSIFRGKFMSGQNILSIAIRVFVLVCLAQRCVPDGPLFIDNSHKKSSGHQNATYYSDDASGKCYLSDYIIHDILTEQKIDSINSALLKAEPIKSKEEQIKDVVHFALINSSEKVKHHMSPFITRDPKTGIVHFNKAFTERLLRELIKKRDTQPPHKNAIAKPQSFYSIANGLTEADIDNIFPKEKLAGTEMVTMDDLRKEKQIDAFFGEDGAFERWVLVPIAGAAGFSCMGMLWGAMAIISG